MYVIDSLLKEKPIDGFLTSKVDGSLVIVNLYSLKYKTEFIKGIIDNYGDEFHKKIYEIAKSLSMPFVPIFSSNNTYLYPECMYDYLVTALCGQIYTNDELVDIAKTKKPIDLLDVCLPVFFDQLQMIYNVHSINKKRSLAVSFEAICKNRTTAWKTKHSELTISYPISNLYYLGITINFKDGIGQFIPHFHLGCDIFEAPLYWKINHTNQIDSMIEDLESIFTDKMTESDFLNKYPAENMTNSLLVNHNFLDYEGFVFFVDTSNLKHLNPTKIMDYSKIKTPTYYMCHKIKEHNIEKIGSMPISTHNKLPAVAEIYYFYNDLDGKIKKSVIDVLEYAKNNFELLSQTLEPKVLKGIENAKDPNIKVRILIANIKNIFYQFFVKYFVILTDTPEVNDILKSIVLTVMKDMNIIITMNNCPQVKKLFVQTTV